MRLVVLAAALVLMPAGASHADEKAWAALKAGGHVVLIRHALTTPGVGDPEGMRLEDCATQRNLGEQGRAEAKLAAQAVAARGIPIGRVLSSPWCRCIETAKLVFGREPEISVPLSNLFGRPQNREKQVSALQSMVGERVKGGNLVLVSHGSTIHALTGVSPESGEMVVVSPRGGGKFELVGRVVPYR